MSSLRNSGRKWKSTVCRERDNRSAALVIRESLRYLIGDPALSIGEDAPPRYRCVRPPDSPETGSEVRQPALNPGPVTLWPHELELGQHSLELNPRRATAPGKTAIGRQVLRPAKSSLGLGPGRGQIAGPHPADAILPTDLARCFV
jgi:hypothetical protein